MVVLILSGLAIGAVETTLRSSTKVGRARRIVEWILYIAIAILLVVVLLLYAVHQARTGGSSKLPLKWLGFAATSAVVFGYAVKAGWRTRMGPKFWLLLGAFFVVHTGVGLVVLMRVEAVPLLLYALWGWPEYLFLMNCLDFFLRSDPRYR